MLQIDIWNALGQRWCLKSRDEMRTPRKWMWKLKTSEDSIKGHYKNLKAGKKSNQKRIFKRNSHWFRKKTSRIWFPKSQGKRVIQGGDGQLCTMHLWEKGENWEFNHWVWQDEGDYGIILSEELWGTTTEWVQGRIEDEDKETSSTVHFVEFAIKTSR